MVFLVKASDAPESVMLTPPMEQHDENLGFLTVEIRELKPGQKAGRQESRILHHAFATGCVSSLITPAWKRHLRAGDKRVSQLAQPFMQAAILVF